MAATRRRPVKSTQRKPAVSMDERQDGVTLGARGSHTPAGSSSLPVQPLLREEDYALCCETCDALRRLDAEIAVAEASGRDQTAAKQVRDHLIAQIERIKLANWPGRP